MTGLHSVRELLAVAGCVVLTAAGCGFNGMNSLPLPGTVGRGSDRAVYHIEVANVGQLEPNSPVMIDDVTVGTIAKMTVAGSHADVEISVKPDVVIPTNVQAAVGQTSLLGSMHLELGPPLGQPPTGRLPRGATVPLSQTSTYPSTEQTLSAISVVANNGGLGQIGDIVHSLNTALSGRESRIRDLIARLDTFVGTLNDRRDDITATIGELNRLAETFATQRDSITRVLGKLPPALDVLVHERARITTAFEKLGTLSDTTTALVDNVQTDLVKNLENLAPTVQALADVGPDLGDALAVTPVWPYVQDSVDRAIRGDYINMFATLDLTIPRLKRTLFLGTRWGQEGAYPPPAPGDPWYRTYTFDPLDAGVNPPQAHVVPDPAGAALGAVPPQVPAQAAVPPELPAPQAVLPVAPPPGPDAATLPPGVPEPIFAGPYPQGTAAAPEANLPAQGTGGP